MHKTNILILILVYFLFWLSSCSSNEAPKQSVSTTAPNEPIEEKEKLEKPEMLESFEIKNFTCYFEKIGKGANAVVNINIKNNTLDVLNNIELVTCIEAKFNDENKSISFYPTPFSDVSEEDYLSGPIAKQYAASNNIEKKIKWKSVTEEEFEFKIFKEYGLMWKKNGFDDSDFERTPLELVFVCKYKFIGLDNEYGDIIRIDIKQSWTDYQKKIGLRD